MYRQQTQVFNPNYPGVSPVEVAGFWPKVDVAETSGEIFYIIEIPGAEENTVNVEINNGTLRVEGQVERGMKNSHFNYLYQERPAYTQYSRLLLVPPQVDGEKAEANLKNGILVVRFPKKTTGRRLQVSALGDSPQQEQLHPEQTPPTTPPPQQQNPFYPPSGL